MFAPFWRSESCVVTVGYVADGSLEFRGDDLRAFGIPGYGHEYAIAVPKEQFPALRRALGVDDAADVLAALGAHSDEVMAEGEGSWLAKRGVEHRRSVWSTPPDD